MTRVREKFVCVRYFAIMECYRHLVLSIFAKFFEPCFGDSVLAILALEKWNFALFRRWWRSPQQWVKLLPQLLGWGFD